MQMVIRNNRFIKRLGVFSSKYIDKGFHQISDYNNYDNLLKNAFVYILSRALFIMRVVFAIYSAITYCINKIIKFFEAMETKHIDIDNIM